MKIHIKTAWSFNTVGLPTVISFLHLFTFQFLLDFLFVQTCRRFSLSHPVHEMCCTNTVTLSCCWNEHPDFFIAPLRYVLCFSCPSLFIRIHFLLLLSCTLRMFCLYSLTHLPSFTMFLIIFNFSFFLFFSFFFLLFSCCCDTVSLRGSIKFHLIWTWWNCVTLSEELSLLYLVQILNWVWCCDPAALILRVMDSDSSFVSDVTLSALWEEICSSSHRHVGYLQSFLTLCAVCLVH